MLSYIPMLILGALLGWVIFTFVHAFMTCTGTVTERIFAAAKGSLTILWSKFIIIVTTAGGLLADSADYLNLPETKAAIQAATSRPEYVAAAVALIAFVTIWARRRHSSLEPIGTFNDAHPGR